MPHSDSVAQASCLNCQQPLTGKFCANCGQEVKQIRLPFFFLLRDAFSSVFELDGRAFHTLFLLFTKPGFLSREYINGKRASYTPPLRLFLVISISFFLIVSAFTSIQSLSGDFTGQEQEAAAAIENVTTEIDAEVENDFEPVFEFIDGFGIPFLSERRNENLRRYMRIQTQENLEELSANPADFLYDSLEYVTIFILLMMPILALIQKIMYIGSKSYYVEHLILTLHNHSFLILAIFFATVSSIIENLQITLLSMLFSYLGTAISIWAMLYLFLSLKNFFQQGYAITLLKFITMAVIYSIVTAIGIFYFAAILFFMF